MKVEIEKELEKFAKAMAKTIRDEPQYEINRMMAFRLRKLGKRIVDIVNNEMENIYKLSKGF